MVRHGVGNVPDFVEQLRQCRTISHSYFAAEKVEGLNTVGPLVDRADSNVSVELGGTGVLAVPHATKNLNAERGHFVAQIGAPRFGKGGVEVSAFVRSGARCTIG